MQGYTNKSWDYVESSVNIIICMFWVNTSQIGHWIFKVLKTTKKKL